MATAWPFRTVNLSGIPHELISADRWGLWRFEERDDKPTKVPYSAMTGRRASSTKTSDWGDFPTVAAYLLRRRQHDGLGFVLGDGWAGIDLDGCRDAATGELHPKAADIVARLASYTEVSPSGTGVKVFVHGLLPSGRRKIEEVFGKGEHKGIEMYDSGRYFTVTGARL